MRQAVGRPAKQAHGFAKVKAHGLAPSGQRGMDGGGVVGGEFGNGANDLVCRCGVVFGADQVVERLLVGPQHNVYVRRAELDGAGGQAQGFNQSREMTFFEKTLVQCQLALLGGDDANLVGNERVFAPHEGVDGLGNDLRRGAGNGQQHSAVVVHGERLKCGRHGYNRWMRVSASKGQRLSRRALRYGALHLKPLQARVAGV